MRTCLLLLCFPFTLSVNGQRVTKVVTTKINFEVKGINDTLLEFYDDKDRVYKSEDSYGVSYKFYNDTMVCKQINVSKNIGKKNCRDTILFLYYYNKDQLSSSIIKSNKCPREPGGSDGFIRYEDTVQLSLETIDSIVYKYDKQKNIIEEQSFNPNDKKPHSSIKKNYDSLNRIVEERKFLGDSLRTLIKYEYKDSTRIIDDYWYWFENKNLSPGYNKFIETYNQKGQILLKVKIQYPNLYSEKTIYSYRYDDKLDSEVTFSGNSILAKIIKYDYY